MPLTCPPSPQIDRRALNVNALSPKLCRADVPRISMSLWQHEGYSDQALGRGGEEPAETRMSSPPSTSTLEDERCRTGGWVRLGALLWRLQSVRSRDRAISEAPRTLFSTTRLSSGDRSTKTTRLHSFPSALVQLLLWERWDSSIRTHVT